MDIVCLSKQILTKWSGSQETFGTISHSAELFETGIYIKKQSNLMSGEVLSNLMRTKRSDLPVWLCLGYMARFCLITFSIYIPTHFCRQLFFELPAES